MTSHKCQGMTVGDGEASRYVVIHPGKHDFEATNPGALFVALSRAKSAGGEGTDPGFAFHEDFLINDDRFKPVDTPTTRCLFVLFLAATYSEETFLKMVEWAQSQGHR